MENKFNHMDESFKKAFDDFEVPPRPRLWDEIKVEIDTQPLDKAFESNFVDFEMQPEKEVWNNIEKHLPLNLFIKRHLHRLSKVAAVLLFIMVSIIAFNPRQNHMVKQEDTAVVIEQPKDEVIETQPQDVVFQVETKDEEKKKISRKKSREIKRKKRVNQLWESIISDEDDFAGINKAKIEEVLKPIERLPLEDFAEILEQKTFRNLPGKGQDSTDFTEMTLPEVLVTADKIITPPEEELKIWIPLKVVEDYEVEALIQVYNQGN